MLAYGTNMVQASYGATDSTVTDASSKDLVLVRVQPETTTICTSVPWVKEGTRLVATATVVSTHGQPVVGQHLRVKHRRGVSSAGLRR